MPDGRPRRSCSRSSERPAPASPTPCSVPYVRYGTKRRADGRIVWKRDPQLVKGFVATDLWRFVREIKTPILYVIGGRSTIVPAETQDELKKTLPKVRIVTMPGLGHYPSDEKPDGVPGHRRRVPEEGRRRVVKSPPLPDRRRAHASACAERCTMLKRLSLVAALALVRHRDARQLRTRRL